MRTSFQFLRTFGATEEGMNMLLQVTGAAARSGITNDERNEWRRHAPGPTLGAEFEADLQCALTNTSPVLITGPSEFAEEVATRIHRNGLNKRGAFLTVDCARTQRPDQLEVIFEAAAPRGTVFLRDVDRLAPHLQTALYLRMAPLGVRVIAATSESLLNAAARGTFDERLFYRLNQIHLIAAPAGDRSPAA
jgi:DNA-binding NtrC family response regulator